MTGSPTWGALDRWRAEVRAGVGGQRANAPETWDFSDIPSFGLPPSRLRPAMRSAKDSLLTRAYCARSTTPSSTKRCVAQRPRSATADVGAFRCERKCGRSGVQPRPPAFRRDGTTRREN